MRPRFRFSLKLLFIAFAVLSVSFYVLFIRPTVIANRFVSALNRGDVKVFESLADGVQEKLIDLLHQQDKNIKFEDVKFSAEIKPQSWRDIYKCRRTVWAYLSYSMDRNPNAKLRVYLVAENGGLRADDGS